MRNKENPFKFGTIVDDEFFTDRVQEIMYIKQYINSVNHLVLISPRRFGKSSVIARALKQSGRKSITVNLQQTTSVTDLSARILREFFKEHPIERVKHLVAKFRIFPMISLNPITGSVDVSFQPGMDGAVCLEDVMSLIDNAHTDNDRLVVVLDEFQEVLDMGVHLDKKLRAIMQQQKHINYIMLGSQESMMTDIFENKKSPFYHFGELMRLGKLPKDDFHKYLSERLMDCLPDSRDTLSDEILAWTSCHPYYTQQLAAAIWQICTLCPDTENPLRAAVEYIVTTHSLDYERLWMNLNRTNKWILQRLSQEKSVNTGEYRTSTVYSALKRLQKDGYVIYSDHYEMEDPFFREWIVRSNNA